MKSKCLKQEHSNATTVKPHGKCRMEQEDLRNVRIAKADRFFTPDLKDLTEEIAVRGGVVRHYVDSLNKHEKED